ncbi:hypothetical protein HDU93_004694 [Gonapodya sp. JEL0774]|nr:hypothetical protein HDU93_004694 [Gonapodya sp. JEL0774]
MSIIHISVSFPSRAGLLLAMISGAFDASGIVFPAYEWVYEAFGWKPTDFFRTYTSVPLLLLIESFEWASDDPLPIESTGSVAVEDEFTQSLHKVHSDDTITPQLYASSSSERTPLLDEESQVQPPGHGSGPSRLSQREMFVQSMTVMEQLRTPEFVLNATWIFLTTVRINFYIATLGEQLGEKQAPGEEAMRDSIVAVFNIANSIGAVAMIVPMG